MEVKKKAKKGNTNKGANEAEGKAKKGTAKKAVNEAEEKTKKEFQEKLGRTVKRLRDAKQLTAAKLAESVGIKTSYVTHIEGGKRSPSLDVLQRLAKALDITVSELIGESPYEMPEGMASLVREARDLSYEQMDALLGMVKAFKSSNDKEK